MTEQKNKPKAETGMKEGWTRKTFIVNKETIEKIKRCAYWQRLQIKEVMELAFREYLKGKNTKPIPPTNI